MAAENLNMEMQRCLEIFPNEIWEAILYKVKGFSDYLRICSASTHLRALLVKFRAGEILFPKVAHNFLEPLAQQSDGYIYDVTKLRNVCSSWQETVDANLQNLNKFGLVPTTDDKNHKMIARPVSRFDDIEDYYRFEENFDATHLSADCNPFVGRRVTFTFRVPRNLLQPSVDELYNECSQVLRKYGHHVWYCGFDQDVQNPLDRREFYNRLPTMLEKMPNLRGLEVEEYFSDYFKLVWDSQLGAPFPELPQLCYLYLHGAPLPVIQEIATRNPQIMYLNISGPQTPDTVYDYMQLSNLKGLHVELRDQDQTFETFSCARFWSRKIQKLHLNMISMQGTVSWKTTFRVLRTHFSDSLESLYLALSQPKRKDDEYLRRGLALANLKVLHLELQIPVSLDFILPMANHLRKFALIIWEDEESRCFERAKQTESVVKVYQFWQQPEKSNAWEIFPKLNQMTVGTLYGEKYSRTRDTWIADVECKRRNIDADFVQHSIYV